MNAKTRSPRTVRCAIYTRKSTEEGLEQEFNSLAAQREAAQAYIASQHHEGWLCLPETYDDGGFTGANTDRPGLQRLLADCAAGRIDCVVVYKVDRLSRSLLDFGRIIETFDQQQVAFVSVTQQFNTATSMGRLVLNVLLSLPILNLGDAFVRTIRHCWPELNGWLEGVPDSRFQPYVVYHKRFLIWWGLALYLFQLGARRSLDFALDRRDSDILANLNRLAKTEQDSRPVNQTLHHFLGHTGVAPYPRLRRLMLQRLIRSKALDAARVQGRFVVALDATGHLRFTEKHCDYCLVQRQAMHTTYLHQLLEAKLLGTSRHGVVDGHAIH